MATAEHRCQYCRQSIAAASVTCYYCGRTLGTFAAPAPAQRAKVGARPMNGALSDDDQQALYRDLTDVLRRFGCVLDSLTVGPPLSPALAPPKSDYIGRNPPYLVPDGTFSNPLRFWAK